MEVTIMKTLDSLTSYQVLQHRRLKDIQSDGALLEHKRSGARIILLSNDDENKVFTIGFRTPPVDNTGLTHILEHAVLCGSRKFPAKDSFVELAKGSLNTFLNAMTFADKTIYPVASRNDQDFQNLMDVYMDAVLHPNIHHQEEIFLQEGWNYNLEAVDAELKYNGVVYNEMKGAFSAPERVVYRSVLNTLFPDTIYSYESGGHPDDIPNLQYQELLAYHSKYYHPSNSYIYLYGNMDMEGKLKWLDEAYLAHYDRADAASDIALQAPFHQRAEAVRTYPIGSGESEENRSYLTYNAVIGTSLDPELTIAFQILHYALLGSQGAPLRQSILDQGIAKEVYGTYQSRVYQPFFSIVAKGSNQRDRDQFVDTITNVLNDLVSNGIDRDSLLAGISLYEFQYREADFGRYPKGLSYALQALGSWLYDDNAPFVHLENHHIFNRLRENMDKRYFEGLIERYLIRNTHASIVSVVPESGLSIKKEQKLRARLQTYRDQLNPDELQQLVDRTKALKAYQNEPSTKEQSATIPLLSREDLDPKSPKLGLELDRLDDTTILYHPLFTNGIGYLRLCFDLSNVPQELLAYAGVLEGVIGSVDTERFSYHQLANRINIHTGGIHTSIDAYGSTKQVNGYKAVFEFQAKVLYSQLSSAFELIQEMILSSKFDDTKRLYELIAQLKSSEQRKLISSGHLAARERALSYHSAVYSFRDRVGGISHYRLLEHLESHFDEEKEGLIHRLKELAGCIFRPENLLVSYTAEQEGIARVKPLAAAFKGKLFHHPVQRDTVIFTPEFRNEGFKTSSEVQYAAQTGNFIDKGYQYSGSLRVLKMILSYDYLWNQIRVKGGAYGCMTGFQRDGNSYMVSYRDPNLARTYEVYAQIPDYLRSFKASDQEMTRYIIGAIRELEPANSPAAASANALASYLSEFDDDDLQRERDEVLNTTAEDVAGLAPLVESVLELGSKCTVGNEDSVEAQRQLFHQVLPLFEK